MDKKIEYLAIRYACIAAWIDGEVQNEESSFINDKLNVYHLEDTQREEIKSILSNNVNATKYEMYREELIQSVHNNFEKIFVLNLIRKLINADKFVHEKEKTLINYLEKALDDKIA